MIALEIIYSSKSVVFRQFYTIRLETLRANKMSLLAQLKSAIAPLVSRIKPFLRWLILGGTLFFLAHTLQRHWQEVTLIRINETGWGLLAIALLVTLLAHAWAGWVWSWILEELGYHALGSWSILAYLKTNIAKYLPGNIWHFYGRVMAAKSVGVPLEGAAISVAMEPLLMAIAALMVAFISNRQLNMAIQTLGLLTGLILIHPRVMNPVVKKLAAAKRKLQPPPSPSPPFHPAASLPHSTTPPYPITTLTRYPLLPLAGELIFLLLRGAGFIVTVMALYPLPLADIFPLLSAFSLAWMLGLIVPGAPGGIGVFEATALALLDGSTPPGILLGAVAFYRLVSTLAEALAAAIAWGAEQCISHSS